MCAYIREELYRFMRYSCNKSTQSCKTPEKIAETDSNVLSIVTVYI